MITKREVKEIQNLLIRLQKRSNDAKIENEKENTIEKSLKVEYVDGQILGILKVMHTLKINP